MASKYEQLVRALRYCGKKYFTGNECKDCIRFGTGPLCDDKMKLDAAAAIEALEAKVADYEDTLKWHQKEFAELCAMIDDANARLEVGKAGNKFTLNATEQPHWVSVEEPPKRNDTVLVRDNGYRVLTYLGDGRWEDDYGYGAEFVSDDAEWCYIEPPQEVQDADR